MTEPKRGRGRPRKEQPVEETNPDCEIATKGFVKCIARDLIEEGNHNYYENKPEEFSGATGIIMICLLTLGCVLALAIKSEPVAAWVCGTGAVVLVTVMIELEQIKSPKIVRKVEVPTHLKKYKPKKECE